jgi:hypothetical protein
MIGMIGKIAVLLGIGGDDNVFDMKKRKPRRARRENDTVTISSEARRLLASGEEWPEADGGGHYDPPETGRM